MTNNAKFFRDNVDFYSDKYKNYSLKPWEKKIVDLVSGPEVLDVACGGGRMTVPLLRRGYNVTGVDFIGEFEAKIRRHESEFVGRFRFVESDMNNLPFSTNTFDSVICINSIVYLENAGMVYGAMKEMSRVLKPLGKLYITSWSLRHPLWGISVVLNYLLRRGKEFGETSPFWTTDSRIKNSRTYMFVPSRNMLGYICRAAGVSGSIYTGPEFVNITNNRNLLAMFHPILVIAGTKNKNVIG